MYSHQPLIDLAGICAQKGVVHAVLSPGSRCAPLTVAFVREPSIKAITIADERSAAFIGLGLAQQSKTTTVLVCTSGTAALNYSPAITEAFYQQIPLLVLTADRPEEWIDQQDGQAIHQNNLYGSHVKASYSLPSSYSHADASWHIGRIVSEAINMAETFPQGPVHINVPIREPFYPSPEETIASTGKWKIIEETRSVQNLAPIDWDKLVSVWNTSGSILVVGGQHHRDDKLSQVLGKLGVTVINDVVSNLHHVEGAVHHAELFLFPPYQDPTKLKPELLITFGQSIISKNLKLYLREYKAAQHWHIQPAGYVADTYQSLTRIIRMQPDVFFENLLHSTAPKAPNDFSKRWKQLDHEAQSAQKRYFETATFSELLAVKNVVENLPENTNLHLANSMAVRYANYISGIRHKNVEVFANRGTSGIDGCTSTAVGHALADSSKTNVLITGDISFFYDRNALWNNYLPTNLKVVLLNNHGGVIFRMIKGPSQLPELEEYFETKQPLTAKRSAEDAKMTFFEAKDAIELQQVLPIFLSASSGASLLEIETKPQQNKDAIQAMKKFLPTI